jgi:DMSO reductase anchor subunit
VRARPAWNSGYTVTEFFATAFLLGPLFVRAAGVSEARWIVWTVAAGGATQLSIQALKFLWLSHSDVFELRASSLLISGRFRTAFLTRLGILITVIVMVLMSFAEWAAAAAFVLALAGETLGRWMFFVTVVPKNMAAAFSAGSREAA